LTAGRVEQVFRKPGDVVDAHTIILELANEELEHAVLEAELSLAQAEAELAAERLRLKSQVLEQRSRLAEARSNESSARMQADAEAAALARNAVSRLQAERSRVLADQAAERVKVEVERLDTLADAVNAQLRAQDARYDQSRKALQRQRELAASLNVRAGMDGVLQLMPAQVGQQVAEGTLLARVAKPEPLIAQIRIPENDARDVQVGLPADVDLRGTTVAGRVARVDPAVQNGTVRLEIELLGAMPNGARPDLSVDGTVDIERTPDRLILGRLAYGEPGTEVTVFRLDADGSTAKRVPVRVGSSSVKETEIVSGLAPGDRVIISSITEWSDRDELKLR